MHRAQPGHEHQQARSAAEQLLAALYCVHDLILSVVGLEPGLMGRIQREKQAPRLLMDPTDRATHQQPLNVLVELQAYERAICGKWEIL